MEPEQQCPPNSDIETDVGVTAFCSPLPEFAGILKHRFVALLCALVLCVCARAVRHVYFHVLWRHIARHTRVMRCEGPQPILDKTCFCLSTDILTFK